MEERRSTMTILAVQRTSSFPRESKHGDARNLCFLALAWICFVGHEFSVAAAAQSFAKGAGGSRAVNRLSAAAGVRPITRSYTVSREVQEVLSVAAAAEVLATSKTGTGTERDLPVTASAERIVSSLVASKAFKHQVDHELPVQEETQRMERSHNSSRPVNKLSQTIGAAQPTAKTNTGSRVEIAAAAPPIVRSSKGSKAGKLPAGDLAPAAAAKPIARSETVSVTRIAARPTATRSTGSSAVDTLSRAAAKKIPRRKSNSRAANHDRRTLDIPTIGKLGPLKTTAAWQIPRGPIKKVVVIFEDILVQPYEFWDRSPSCQQCTGLPEKRKIVIDAIARNYAVLIPHPLDLAWEDPDGIWKEFSPSSPDILNILYMIGEWKSEIGLQDNVPTVGLGVSELGGNIVSIMGLVPGIFESIAIMISPGSVEAFKSSTRDYPPTIFIHMPKNTATAEKVYYDRKLLRANGVPTKEVRWYEHSVTEYWFAELIPGLDQATSSKIHRHLREIQWLDKKTGFLQPDSDFQNEFFEKVHEWNLFPTDLTEGERLMFEDRVYEELNVAYAYHVTLARSNIDLFAWFEGGYETMQATEERLHSQPAPISLSKQASYSPVQVSPFQASSYPPAPVSFFKVASY